MHTAQEAPPRDEVRELIKRLMKAKGVTIRDVIDGAGVSQGAVYEYLGAKRGMQSGNVSKILAYLRKRRTKGGVLAQK